MEKVKKTKKLGIITIIGLMLILATHPVMGAEQLSPTKEKPLTLRLSHFYPPTGPLQDIIKKIAETIQTASGGRVVVELFAGGTLCPPKETLAALKAGVADIAYLNPGYTPGTLPEMEIVQFPTYYSQDIPNEIKDLNIPVVRGVVGIAEKIGQDLVKELHYEALGIKVITLFAGRQTSILWSTNKPIRSIADIKGLKVAVPSEMVFKFVDGLGATGTQVPGAETYMALQRGVINGWITPIWAAKMMRVEEICKYAVDIKLATWSGGGIAMNLELYNKLPRDIREIVEKALWEAELETGRSCLKWDEDGVKALSAANLSISKLTSAEYGAMFKPLAKLWEEDIASKEKAGVKGIRKFANDYLNVGKKYW